MENGSFYITSKELLTQTQNRLGGVIGYYEMSEENSLELDEPLDWLILEEIARNKLGN
jgi:N-acylneuraminate cytidylyltransferase